MQYCNCLQKLSEMLKITHIPNYFFGKKLVRVREWDNHVCFSVDSCLFKLSIKALTVLVSSVSSEYSDGKEAFKFVSLLASLIFPPFEASGVTVKLLMASSSMYFLSVVKNMVAGKLSITTLTVLREPLADLSVKRYSILSVSCKRIG